ncbi:uncharacterized protein LOC123425954 [Hordeum vulgare subsp. vulgare]|uniref:uncharacterized protein LOC123425954 n=1 Tax=Hordeum vulgare subsp. vulgare TaxID=112509 RepID=UPI000B47F62E|nr:uncharacterized protein LOC123425954 [Hordeum vulgare subsp. vulgare]
MHRNCFRQRNPPPPRAVFAGMATRLGVAQTCSATLAGNHLMRDAAALPETVIHGELVPFVSWFCLRVCLCCCTSICLLFCLSHGVSFYWRAGEGGATQGEGVNMAVVSRSPTFDIARDFIDKIELQPMFVAQERAAVVSSRKCCSVSRH